MLLRHNQKGPKLHPNVVIDQMETFSLILMLRLVLTIILLGETSAFFSTTAEGSIPIMTYFDNGVFNLFIGCCSQGHLRYHVGLLVAGGILVVLSNAKKYLSRNPRRIMYITNIRLQHIRILMSRQKIFREMWSRQTFVRGFGKQPKLLMKTFMAKAIY